MPDDAPPPKPTPPLRIQVLVGPNANQILQFDASPITFGRVPGNALVLDDPIVSRQHGQLVCDPTTGCWSLHNASTNGTQLNRKTVKNKPRPLSAPGGSDTLSIAGNPILQITVLPPTADPNAADTAAAEAGPTIVQAPKPKRKKLWLGIGIYLGLMAVVFVVLLTAFGEDDQDPTQTGFQPLTDDQIKQLIEQDPEARTPDPTAYSTNLLRARRFFAESRTNPETIYFAYEAYRAAMAVNDGTLDDPADVTRYYTAMADLVQSVTAAYNVGQAQFNQRQFDDAADTFSRIRDDLYRANSGELRRNLGQFIAASIRNADD
ncbi:MAG: FHA domain-containing protein [Planctomycetota bacterium]